MVKYLGIYIDYNGALLISLINGQADLTEIPSHIDHSKTKGGARSKKPYGPQDKISESKKRFRREQQENEYFQKLLPHLYGISSLHLFGHGQAKYKFAAYLKKDNRFRKLPVSLENVGNITRNQAVAKVRTFFSISEKWQVNKPNIIS